METAPLPPARWLWRPLPHTQGGSAAPVLPSHPVLGCATPPTECSDVQPPPLLVLDLGPHTCTRSDISASSDVQPLPKEPPSLQPHSDLGSPTLHRGRGGNSVIHRSPQTTHSCFKRTARASRQEHDSVHADGQRASSASSSRLVLVHCSDGSMIIGWKFLAQVQVDPESFQKDSGLTGKNARKSHRATALLPFQPSWVKLW